MWTHEGLWNGDLCQTRNQKKQNRHPYIFDCTHSHKAEDPEQVHRQLPFSFAEPNQEFFLGCLVGHIKLWQIQDQDLHGCLTCSTCHHCRREWSKIEICNKLPSQSLATSRNNLQQFKPWNRGMHLNSRSKPVQSRSFWTWHGALYLPIAPGKRGGSHQTPFSGPPSQENIAIKRFSFMLSHLATDIFQKKHTSIEEKTLSCYVCCRFMSCFKQNLCQNHWASLSISTNLHRCLSTDFGGRTGNSQLHHLHQIAIVTLLAYSQGEHVKN